MELKMEVREPVRHCSLLQVTIRYVEYWQADCATYTKPSLLQNIYSVSKAKEKDIATATKLINIKEKDAPSGKGPLENGKKDVGKESKKGSKSPRYSSRKQRQQKNECEGKENKDNKNNRNNRRSSSRRKGSNSNRKIHHKKHRSHSSSKKSRGHHRRHSHSRSRKKSAGKRNCSPKGKENAQKSPPPPSPCAGKEAPCPPAEQKAPNKSKEKSASVNRKQAPEESETQLIAPVDYKVCSTQLLFTMTINCTVFIVLTEYLWGEKTIVLDVISFCTFGSL